jgi:hypothetical protein
MMFSIGALLVEVAYVRVSLVAMQWFLKNRKWMVRMGWITFLVISALAMASFWAAMHPSSHGNPILSGSIPKFLLGALMSAINPMQVPFWFGWSSVLFERGILKSGNSDAWPYILGIGIGTFMGNSIFIYGGRLMVDKMQANQSLVNWIIGGIFAVTALFQLYRVFKGTNAELRIPD